MDHRRYISFRNTICLLFLRCKLAIILFLMSYIVYGDHLYNFGKGGKAETLWQCAVFALLWVIWQEQNSRKFEKGAKKRKSQLVMG